MTTNNKQKEGVQGAPRWAWGGLAILLLFLILVGGVRSCSSARADARKEKAAQADSIAAVQAERRMVAMEPTKVRATTPATITADYGFSLEADGPIMVQYPGEAPFLFDPKGDNCQQLPQPRRSGPKKFWDPSNPANGHVGFRIYRGRGVC